MTAPYQPEDESPREACANLAMCFRALAREASRVEGVVAGRTGHWEVTQKGFSEWASRLERAVQRLDSDAASLREALVGLRRHHWVEDDCWYSCPLALREDGSSECCDESRLKSPRCNCGADEHNAKIDALVKHGSVTVGSAPLGAP